MHEESTGLSGREARSAASPAFPPSPLACLGSRSAQKAWERLHSGEDQTSKEPQCQPSRDPGEGKGGEVVWTIEPVYIVYWFSETVVQAPYLPLESISPRRP